MNEVLMETVVTQPADNGAKEYIYGIWDRFNSYHSEFDISDTYGRTVGILGQVLAILERPKEAGATKKFASEALKLTQKVVDLCHPLSLKTGKGPLFPKDSPSGKRDFIVSFETIESQFQHLISWEIGFGPPLLPDGSFVGLEKDVQLLTSRLIAGEAARQVVFIVGQRQTGKTTLAQMVYNNAFVQTHFDCRAWVTISWNFSSTSALLNIASQVIPYELLREVRSLEDLFILLRDFLGGRKYLIVLDHSSIIEDWNILVKLLPLNEFNGSRIISTTRISGKEYDVPNSFILEMRRLSDEEGWELLKTKVGFKMTGELENLGRAIVKKSRGLPGQLLLMGSWLPYKPATREQAYVRAFWKIFQFYSGFRCQKERDSLVGTLGQLVAILELGEEVGATENFAIEAFGLTQNIFDIWDRGSFKMEDNELEPSDLIALGLIENQIKDLIRREIGFGPPPMGDGQGQLLVGLEEEVQLVTSRLMEDKAVRGVVSIVGREGIGKTTLAQMVYDSDVVREHFCYHTWVTVPQNSDPRSVLLKIAVQVLPLERLQKAVLVEELAKFLIDKTCLIVLDGVQTPEDWNILEKLLPTEINQIVITTRCRDIIHDGADYFVLEKRALSDEEAWELLNARVRFSIPASLEQLGRGIVMKCTGLPLAICKVGDELSKKEPTQDQWYMVLQQINQDQLSMYGSLDMAANELPLNFKQCLLYLGHFHEDYEVPVRRLIAYWVAEGLLQKIIDMNEPPECVAEKLLMVLVQENLIMVAKWKLNGKAKTCRMNHHLRDNWLSKAKEANSHPKSKGATSKSSSGTGMILQLADHLNKEDECFPHIHGNNTISSSSLKKIYRELFFFVSFDFREGPLPGEEIGSFFHKCIVVGCFKKLRVVDLEGVFRPKLPDSIGKLTQLRYLGLRWTYLQMLPSSIGKLLNLQTLDLKRTYISSLPASLWKLQQLRHLYLSEFFRCRFVPPPKNSMLMDLQTLWGAYVNEEIPIKDGLDRLTNLRKLGLAFRLTLSEQKALADWITKLKDLESLRLVSLDHEATQASNICLEPLSDLKKLLSIYFFGRLENPIIVHSLPKSLTEITLSRSGLREDPMPKLGELPDLRILRLQAGSYCGKKLVCCPGGFPLLRILKFWELEELEEWTMEEGTLKILREVEIRSCKKLEMLPDGLKHLHHCRELMITNMPKEFKARIIESQGQDWQKIAHVPSVIVKG